MPTQHETIYLTKADASHRFQRSERSLSRDITNAIKLRDLDVLRHVRLRLEDGTLRPGTEITIEQIILLRDEGQNPTWELAVDWLQSRFGRRGDTPQEEDLSGRTPLPVPTTQAEAESIMATERMLPTEPALRLAVLEALNSELETRNKEKDSQIRRLEIELDRRAQERIEENELQRQNNVLMQQVYDLLKKMQPQLPGPLTYQRSQQSPEITVEADVVKQSGGEGESVSQSQTTPRDEPVPATPRTRKSAVSKSRKRAAKPAATGKEESNQHSAGTWFGRHLPTFSRFLPARKK